MFRAFSEAAELPVTFGSIVRLKTVKSNRYLFSLPAQWSEGRQVVTASSNRVDLGTYWQVVSDVESLVRSEISCGSSIHLQHVNTKNYLTLTSTKSDISGHVQVIGVASSQSHSENTSAGAPAGSLLRVRCKEGEIWRRGDAIQISDSAGALVGLTGVEYSQRNCPNCVINGDMEISHSPRFSDFWEVQDGVIFEMSEISPEVDDEGAHDEL